MLTLRFEKDGKKYTPRRMFPSLTKPVLRSLLEHEELIDLSDVTCVRVSAPSCGIQHLTVWPDALEIRPPPIFSKEMLSERKPHVVSVLLDCNPPGKRSPKFRWVWEPLAGDPADDEPVQCLAEGKVMIPAGAEREILRLAAGRVLLLRATAGNAYVEAASDALLSNLPSSSPLIEALREEPENSEASASPNRQSLRAICKSSGYDCGPLLAAIRSATSTPGTDVVIDGEDVPFIFRDGPAQVALLRAAGHSGCVTATFFVLGTSSAVADATAGEEAGVNLRARRIGSTSHASDDDKHSENGENNIKSNNNANNASVNNAANGGLAALEVARAEAKSLGLRCPDPSLEYRLVPRVGLVVAGGTVSLAEVALVRALTRARFAR